AQLNLDPAERKSGELALVDPETEAQLETVVTASGLSDAVGAMTGLVTVIQDVSGLRELERRRLEQALSESERLAATGRLAASIAHEINNPLEAIQNSLYLLVKRAGAEDPARRFLEIAMKETERMSRILRQMLGFYRPEVAMTPVDVNALIEEAAGLVAHRLRERRARVAKHLDPVLPRIVASADELKQVLLNLLLNAAEAMPEGGAITVTTRRLAGSEAAEAIQIQVHDAGAGIEEEHVPHLFEPFYSTKPEKGTGLGLWVSWGIVQRHGGSLQVRSDRAEGTTFTITLPVGGAADGG
ncbi:MAG: sensor histidine kinase, partial [Thermoleophilaceae bacterium]